MLDSVKWYLASDGSSRSSECAPDQPTDCGRHWCWQHCRCDIKMLFSLGHEKECIDHPARKKERTARQIISTSAPVATAGLTNEGNTLLYLSRPLQGETIVELYLDPVTQLRRLQSLSGEILGIVAYPKSMSIQAIAKDIGYELM